MFDAVPQFEPERPADPERDRAGRARHEWSGSHTAAVLPHGQFRTIVGVLWLLQAVTVPGVWSLAPVRSPSASVAGWVAGAVALVAGGWFLFGAVRSRPFTRAEAWLVLAPGVNAVWPALAALVAPRDSEAFGLILILTMGMGVLHILPALLLGVPAFHRVRVAGDRWTPHQASGDARSGVLLGLSVLIGGWAAAFGMGLFLLIHERGQMEPGKAYAELGAAMTFALPFGMFLGFCCGIFSAILPVPTRFDRSIPRLFIPPFLAGVVGSAINPFLGVLLAGGTLLLMSIVVRRTCRLHPPGSCESCGYSLAGIDGSVCPECGHAPSRA